jgi:purine-nucleoside phosphorylase
LLRFYDVKRIIRVGTAGVYDPELPLRTVVAGSDALTNSSIPALLGAPTPLAASPALLETAQRVAAESGVDLVTGTIFSSDVFYEPDDSSHAAHVAQGVVCVDMECAALYGICALEGAEGLTLLTMTDHLATGEHLSAEERQLTVDQMLELGLRTAVAAK